jgi:TPR repeat protein
MARNTSFTPYDEQVGAPFDQDANDPEFMDDDSPRAVDRYPLSEDRMPLFLSYEADEPRHRGFGSGGERNWQRARMWPRVIKAGIFTASAAVIALAIVSLDNPLAMFANAKASLIGSATDRSDATQGASTQPALAQTSAAQQSNPQPPNPAPAPVVQVASAAPAPVVETAPEIAAAAVPAKISPTRDDIAIALRAAHQNQKETEQPPPVVAAPVRRLEADELAALMKRAKGLIEIGDIAPARLLLERAADAQEASAALLLAQTYDPAVLGTPDMRSITADPAKAREWYQKAASFGSLDAKQRLAQMQN